MTMIRSVVLLAPLVLTASCSAKSAPSQQEASSARSTAPQPATIPQSEVRLLHSKSVGQDFKIFIARPVVVGAPAAQGTKYPVIYTLDGNGEFGTVTEVARMATFGGNQVPRAIVVGIGYPVDVMEETFNLRTRDFTPTRDSAFARYATLWGGEPPTSGGAEAFLRFIREELKPFIEKTYPADPNDATIFGHSLGGLFATYALLHHPETFQRYVIASPSLWWDHRVSFEYEKRYAAEHHDLAATVFFSVGGLETGAEVRKGMREYPEQRRKATEEYYEKNGYPEMVELLEPFAKTLADRRYPSLTVSSFVFPGETHFSVMPMIASRGLRTVFRKTGSK